MANQQKVAAERKRPSQSARKTNFNLERKEEGIRPSPLPPSLIQRAAQAPHTITPAETAVLQRTFGNQALGRLARIQVEGRSGAASSR